MALQSSLNPTVSSDVGILEPSVLILGKDNTISAWTDELERGKEGMGQKVWT